MAETDVEMSDALARELAAAVKAEFRRRNDENARATTVEAIDLRAGMTVRTPGDFKHPAGDWLTVEWASKYCSGGGFVMKVKFTNGLAHDPRVEDLYEVKP